MPSLADAFTHDRLRLKQLQEDLQDIIYLDICVHAFNHFISQRFETRTVSPRTHLTLRWRITTILEKDNSESRNESWQAQIEDVALEITRAAYFECGHQQSPIPDNELEFTTELLKRAFAGSFGSLADKLHAKLEQMTFRHALAFQDRSPLQISEAQKNWQQTQHDNKLWCADPEDVARRIAHMAVLHWRVWAGLVYLDQEGEDEVGSECPTEDDEGPNRQDQIIPESEGQRETGSGATPAVDQISFVDEGGGDLL